MSSGRDAEDALEGYPCKTEGWRCFSNRIVLGPASVRSSTSTLRDGSPVDFTLGLSLDLKAPNGKTYHRRTGWLAASPSFASSRLKGSLGQRQKKKELARCCKTQPQPSFMERLEADC